jgi:hypothetical protein
VFSDVPYAQDLQCKKRLLPEGEDHLVLAVDCLAFMQDETPHRA